MLKTAFVQLGVALLDKIGTQAGLECNQPGLKQIVSYGLVNELNSRWIALCQLSQTFRRAQYEPPEIICTNIVLLAIPDAIFEVEGSGHDAVELSWFQRPMGEEQ